MLDCKLPLPTRPAVPAWSDPRLAMAVGAVRTQVVTVPASTLTALVAPDPKRIAIGFQVKLLPARTLSVGIQGTAADYGAPVSSGGTPLWYDLLTYGALVCQGWECWPMDSGEFPADVLVIELYRQL